MPGSLPPVRETPIESGILSRLGRGARAFLDIVGGKQWLGPGEPIPPVAPPEVQVRNLDYPVGYDYTITPRSYEPVSFQQLQALADNYDLLRIAIETRKHQIARLPWHIHVKRQPGMTAREAQAKERSDNRIEKLTALFRRPDRERSFRNWVNQILENMLVLDAVAIYPRFTLGGEIYSFDVIEASTIARKIDPQGRTPTPPQVAYQQIIHGLPARDLIAPDPKRKDLDQLYYHISNPRPGRIYGFSPVEWVIMTVNIALRRQVTQLEFYTEGGRPDLYATLPKEWITTPQQLAEFQAYWDSLFVNTSIRRQVRFMPEGTKFDTTPQTILKDEYDEWLARVIAWCFGLPPDALVRQVNRATADRRSDDTEEEGLQPTIEQVQDIVNFLLQTYCDAEGLEFDYGSNQDPDPLIQAQVQDLKIKNGTLTVDEGREDDGRAPRGIGEQYWVTPMGPMPVDSIGLDAGDNGLAGEESDQELVLAGAKAVKKNGFGSARPRSRRLAREGW
jgi:hypothetical protein